jgi:hypothetical protein
VVFTGSIRDLEEIERSRPIMAPTLLCRNAFRWAALQSLTALKTIADTSIEHDDPSLVLHQYTIIERILARRIWVMEKPSSTHERAEEGVTCTFRLEVMLNIASAKLENREDFRIHQRHGHN